MSFPSLMVVIAAYNEEEGIGPTLAELREILDEPFYLVVDGNSTDRTVEIAKELGAEVFVQEGRGKGNAIAQAIERIDHDPEYVVLIDADFTYPAEYILGMIQILRKYPSVGMVTGNRFNSHFHLKSMNNAYYSGNRFLAFVHSLFNGVKLNDPLTGLRVVRWEILKNWKPKSKSFDIEVELNRFVEKNGYSIMEFPIHYRQRLGEKKLKLRHGFTILRRILAESL